MFQVIARNNETDTKTVVQDGIKTHKEAYKTVCQLQKTETDTNIVYCVGTAK